MSITTKHAPYHVRYTSGEKCGDSVRFGTGIEGRINHPSESGFYTIYDLKSSAPIAYVPIGSFNRPGQLYHVSVLSVFHEVTSNIPMVGTTYNQGRPPTVEERRGWLFDESNEEAEEKEIEMKEDESDKEKMDEIMKIEETTVVQDEKTETNEKQYKGQEIIASGTEDEREITRMADMAQFVFTTDLPIKLAHGWCNVKRAIVSTRCPHADFLAYGWTGLTTAKASIILTYLYSDMVRWDDIKLRDVLHVLQVLPYFPLDRLMALLQQWLLCKAEKEDCEFLMSCLQGGHYNDMTNDLLFNVIHRHVKENLEDLVFVRSLTLMSSKAISMILRPYKELEVKVPRSTFKEDLSMIIANAQLDVDVEEFKQYLLSVTVSPEFMT